MDWADLISAVGFPIVSFLLCGYFVKYTYDRQADKDLKAEERDDRKWQQLSELTSAVNNNSEVLRQVVHKLEEADNNETNSKL